VAGGGTTFLGYYAALDINLIILAGGKGLRLGRNKALEKIGGKSLLERVIVNLKSQVKDVLLVAAIDSILPKIETKHDIKIVTDVRPVKGPLVGIYSGLLASDQPYNLVVACDMPFLNARLLDYMVGEVGGYDVVVPKLDNIVEPLHAIYSKKCLPVIEKMLDGGDFRVNNLFKKVSVRYINRQEIDRFDPGHLSFFNINTTADFMRADRIAQDVG
jgi:molybdenum cofactor guanylyltransferase